MASPDVSAILAKEFVPLRLEADRMIGGKDILKRYQAGEGGIPWFVFLDGDGKPVVTSDGEEVPHRRRHQRAGRVARGGEQEVAACLKQATRWSLTIPVACMKA
jgi:hypothetical protein